MFYSFYSIMKSKESLIALALVISVSSIASYVHAKELPPKQVYDDRDKIQTTSKDLHTLYTQRNTINGLIESKEGIIHDLYNDMKVECWGYDPKYNAFGKLPNCKTRIDTLPTQSPVHSSTGKVTQGMDLDKLSHAVAYAETGHCKDGTAIKRNNCFGIMTWKSGTRSPRVFKTQSDSFVAFKAIWSKSYKRMPDMALAAKWTGNDHATTWLCHVYTYYNGVKTLTDDKCSEYLTTIGVI